MKVSGLDRSASMWRLLHTFPVIFNDAFDELGRVALGGWDAEDVSRQRMEYTMVCAMICGGFLSKYYVAGTMRLRESEEADQVQMTLEDAEELLHNLHAGIKRIIDMDTPFLSNEHKLILKNT